MAKLKEINIRWLRAKEACEFQVVLFRKTFGEQAELSRSNLLIAESAGLDTEWLAAELLDAAALRDYLGATDAAWRSLEKDRNAAQLAYEDDASWRAQQMRAYEEARAVAWRGFEEARANALADLLGLD